MDRIGEDKILKYNPDTLLAVRRLYNLDKPGQMDEAIDILDAWVKKQNHFVRKDFPREYLERVIVMLKGSVERAKSQMDKICTLRTLLPTFFDKFDAKNDFKALQGLLYVTLLPKLTKDHYRIYMARFEPGKTFTSKHYLQLYYNNVKICEYLKAHDYIDGLIGIIDFRNINMMDFVSQINLTEMRQIVTIGLEGYDYRIKSFLFISTSKTIDVLVKIFKQVLSEKLGKRVHVLKNVEELLEHIKPRELLPSDYGGDEKPLATLHDEFLEVLSSEENIKYLKEISKFRTNESMRTPEATKSNEQFLGLEGTFRTLNVD